MATPLSADRLVAALRAEGLRVVEHGSWRTHNRNHKGPWGPVNGVMIHHTVTSGTARSVTLCYDGYPDLPGPLCHGVIDKDGTVYLVGYGRANHAGLGDDDVLRAVIDERALPAPNENNTDGNARFYGFECINLGDGADPWPSAQLTAIEKAAAAICRAHGWTECSVIGHKEWTNTKVDPRGFSMDTMRARIGRRLAKPPQSSTRPSKPTPEEDDMQLTDQVTLGSWIPKRWPKDTGLADGKVSINTAIGSGYAHARRAAETSEEILAEVKAQRATINELAKALAAHHQEIDADALVARIEAAIERITVRLDVTQEEG